MTTVTISKTLWNTTAQFAHASTAFTVLTIAHKFANPTALIVALIGLALAAGKEFWYDYKYETVDERGSSAEDFAFYALGIVAGLLL